MLDEGAHGGKFLSVHRIVGSRCNDLTGKSWKRQPTPKGIHELTTMGFDAVGDVGVQIIEDGVQTVAFDGEMDVEGLAKCGGGLRRIHAFISVP